MSSPPVAYYGDPEVSYWTFFVFCMVVVSVTLFVMFYAHRVAAQILFRLLSLWTWRKYRATIECESLIVTPLSGKIFFRNLRWTTQNSTINVFRGYLVVRHWVSKCRINEEEDLDIGATPCRFGIYLEGFELFLYNRTGLYGAISDLLAKEEEREKGSAGAQTSTNVQVDEARRTTDLTSHERISKDAFFRRFLPLDVSVRKGAFLVGNPDLPTVLTGHFESARGVYRAVASSSEKDYYRVRHDMELHSVKVSMRHNVDYRARTVAETLQPKQTEAPKSRYTVKDRLVRLVFGVTPTAKSKSIPLTTKAEGWSGLSRYQDAEEPLPHQQRLREEYARVSDVLVGKRLVINHYMDVAGPNVVEPSSPGRTAPEWGAKLTLVEGLFQYGAWSDRQRAILQRYFYPPTFRTQQKTDVAASATRLHSEFKLAILVEGEVTWRVPTQEPSKDWRFPKEGLAEIQISTAPRTLTRPYGWIDLKCSGASRINWTLPLLNQDDGYVSTVALRFENAFLSTSVNYSTFISAPLVKVDFTMPGPLQWNAYRKWNIDISFEEANLWLLRDHITLLSDVVRDWTAGPPSDPAFFIPIDYAFNIVFDRYRLHLCANEGNVIDQPNSLGDNIYFVLRGPRIAWGIVLPFGQQDPPEHSYNMDIRCQDLTVDLLFPPSNTIGAYLSEASSNIGFLRSFDVDICWTIRREHSPIKSDVITMDMRATHARMALFGFLPRYAVWLKENYVGPNTSYVTVDEYRVVAANPAAAQKLRSMQEAAIPPSNPTDLRISLEVEEATVLLPHQIYGGEDVSILKTRSLMLDNRNFEHYQDMMLSCSPISVTEGKASTAELNLPNPSTTNHLSIEDLVVRGHRIFGPQPTNTVYAVDWRIHIANVTGVALPPFLSRLGSAIQAFRKTFLDYDNLNVPYPELFDVTSIEFAVDYVNLAIWGDGSVSSIELEKGITLCTDDWATEKATRRLALDLPSLSISLKSYSENVTTGESWSADRIDFAPWVEVARFQTGVHVQAWIRGPHWESFSRKQRRFLVLQDARTRRAVFYYEDHPDEPFTEADANVISQDYFLPPFHPPMMSHAGGASHMERRRSLSTFSLHRAKANATDLSTSIRSVVAPDEIGSIISHSDDEESATSVQDGASIHIIDGEDEGSSSPTSEDAASPLGWTEAYSTSPLHEPPPSRSIPYKSYLRRFQLALARGSTNPNSGIRFVYVGNDKEQRVDKMDVALRPYLTERDLLVGFTADGRREVPGEARDTVIVQFAQVSEVMVTPVSLKIIEEFVAALDHEVAPPAYIFDNLEETLPGPASRRAPAASKSAELLISIPKVNIHSLQNVTFPEDQTFLTEEGSRIRTRYDLADTMVSPADVVIEGFILRSFQRMASRSATGELLPGSLLPDMDLTELKTDFRLSKVKLNLRFADAFKETGLFGIPATKHHFNDPEDTYSAILEEFPIVLDAYIANPRLVVSYDRLATDKPNKFDCSVGDITVTAINQTVEIVFGAAFSWLTFVGDLEAIIAGYHARSLRQSQILLAAIASCSGPPPRVSDPLFVSQPSALWSLGYRPFQNTPAWRLLHRLRYRMKLCSAVDLERRRTELSDLNSRELWTSLVARLADGQLLTESIMAANPLLASVFPHDAAGTALAQEPSHSRLTLMSVDSMGAQVSLRRVGLLIYEYQTEDNAVVLGPVELCLQVTNPGALTTTSAMSSGPSSQSGIMVKCHGTMDRVGVSLNPNLLAFSKHVLRVYRWFLFRGKPWESSDVARGSGTIIEHTIGPPAPFGPAIGRVNVYGAFRIGSISVKASAHNVLAQLRIASTLASITHSVELGAVGNAFSLGMDATGSPPPFHSTMGKFAKFRVLVMEKAYKTSGAGDQHLASVDVNDGFINAALAKESWSMDSREKAAVLLGSKSAILRVPQSLLKLYTFVERWRDENLPRYDSLISEMIKQLDAPVADSQNSLADRYVPPWDKRDFRFQLSLRSIGVQVDLLSNLRISYDVLDLLAFMDTTLLKPAAKGVAKPRLDFACRIGRQEFHFQTRSKGDPAARFGNQVAGTQSTGFSLPSIGGFCVVTFPDGPTPAIADTGALSVDSYIVVDALNAPISVSMIDHFLTAQSVVGNEINDLLDTLVLARRRAVRERAAGEAVRTSDKSKARDPSLFALKVVFERTRIEASSPSAALVVGADTLEGFVTNRGGELHAVRTTAQPVTSHHFYWKFAANGLSLDVMQHLPHDSLGAEATESTEHQHNTAKLATIASDLSVSNIRDSSSNSRYSQEQHTVGLDEFYVGFRRLHVIMQPSALGKILDFGIFYSMELERRQMQRTADLEKLKESTTLFLKSIDVDLPKTATTSTSLFRNKLIFLEINKIAAVIPLEETERGAAHIPSPGKPLTRKPGVKAFMASIHVLTLTTSRLDVNRGALQEICLQFIHDFDQGNERHFNPAAHTGSANRNRLRIPEISGDVTIVNNVTDRKFRASGAVSGFDAELDSSISRYVNSMVSVWRSGRDRMLQVLPPSNPTTKPQASSGSGVDTGTPIRPNPVAAAGPVVLDIQATFQFRKGGSIRIFSKTKRQSGSKVHSAKPSVGTTRSASHSIRKDPESGNPDQQIHLVTIPGLQLSLRSKTLLGSAGGSSEPAKGLQDKDLRRMHVELLIEKSENTFFPSIITFFNEIITNVTTGDGKSTPLNLMPGGSGGSRLVRASKASETGRVQRTTSGNDVSKSSGLDALSRLREDHHTISVYFRLDSTKIELSCQPVSRVTCAFEIERSNVLLFLNRDSHLDLSASATARIGNLSCRVRHAYSSEDSFKGTVGSVSLNAAMVPKPGAFEYAFQLLVPSITGATNFRHLQDIFFLQSCWIPSSDNGLVVAEAIPARSSAGNTVEPSSSSTSQLSTVPQHIRRQSRVIGSLASLSSGSGPSLRNLEGSSVSLSGSNRSLDAVGADSSSSDSSGPAPIIIVSLIAKIGSIDLSAELGHAIGTTSVIWKGSLIDWKRTDRLGRLPKIAGQLSVSSISMQSVGRLAGLTELQNLRVEVDSADPVGSGSGSPRDLARIVEDLFCVLGVETIRGNFEYQFERILLLDIGLLHGSIARGWTSKDGILDCLVRIGARLDSLRAITSRRTLPTILHLARKISSIIEEKRAYVSSKVAIPGHAVATAKQDTSFGFMGAMQGVAKTRKEIDVYEKVYPVAGQSGSLRGQVTIIITAAAITFFRYNFRDTDSALANLKGLELTLNTRRLEDDRTNHPQVTTTKVGSLQVLKTTGRPITAAEERTWTSEQWFQHIGTFRSAPVLVMPTFTMVLQSLTRCARKLVEYSFNADFAGSVDVALNFALYKYLIELANLYLKALRSSDLNVEAGSRAESSGPGLQSASTSVASLPRPSLISAGSSEALVIPGGSDAGSARGGSDNSSDIGEHVGQQVLPAASISSPIPVIIAPDGDGGRSESGMKFVVVGPVRFEPQLRVMGDATPAEWLEYLGVTKEKVPRVVYSIVTENFELLFAGGCSVAALLSRSADDVAPMLRRASTF